MLDSTPFASAFDSFQSVAQVSPGPGPTTPPLPGTVFAMGLRTAEVTLVEPLHDVDPGVLSQTHLSLTFSYKTTREFQSRPTRY